MPHASALIPHPSSLSSVGVSAPREMPSFISSDVRPYLRSQAGVGFYQAAPGITFSIGEEHHLRQWLHEHGVNTSPA